MIQARQLTALPACGVLCSFSKYLLCQALRGNRKKVPGAHGRETSDKIKHTKGLFPFGYTFSLIFLFRLWRREYKGSSRDSTEIEWHTGI